MDASAFSSLSAVARSCLTMWGAQFFIFEGAPFRLSLKSMPLAKIICKRHFHMSGEMVPPQYSPSDTTSARSPLAVVQSALVEERGHSTRALPSRAGSAVPRDIFCSAPPLGCGSVHVLGGSFARFCVSENVRVPLRYSGQPLHRKIIASRSPNTPWFCLSNRFFANPNMTSIHLSQARLGEM